MNNSARDYYESLFAVALAVCAAGWAWQQVAAVEPASAVAEVEMLPLTAEGPGNGNYCLIPERGAYFYGRDFGVEGGSYERFAEWCSQTGGSLGWSE